MGLSLAVSSACVMRAGGCACAWTTVAGASKASAQWNSQTPDLD
jgi:hypothetical protein